MPKVNREEFLRMFGQAAQQGAEAYQENKKMQLSAQLKLLQLQQEQADREQKQTQFETTTAQKERLGATTVVSPTGEKVAEYTGKVTKLTEQKPDAFTQKQKFQTESNFSSVVNMLSNLWAQKQTQLEETKGSGLVKGTIGKLLGSAKVKGFEATAAYEGQITESALALNRIVSGSTRAIKSIVDKLTKTLPTLTDTASYTKEKIAQSVRNAFGLRKAALNAGLTPEYIDSLPDEELNNPLSKLNRQMQALTPMALDKNELKEAQKVIDSIFATPAIKKQSGRNKPMTYGDYLIEEE